MNSFFKAKNKDEATNQISERLNQIKNDELKKGVVSALMAYSKTRHSLKKYPMMVQCHDSKPSFGLSDGDLLFMFAARINDGEVEFTKVSYGGSADSVLFHKQEQLSSGQIAPSQTVWVFITECASAGTRNWLVDVWVGQQPSLTSDPVGVLKISGAN